MSDKKLNTQNEKTEHRSVDNQYGEDQQEHRQRHLAWHETLEIHELTAFQANGLIGLKQTVGKVQDPQLRNLYLAAIQGVTQNLHELLQFYPFAPTPRDDREYRQDPAYFSGHLLGFAKTSVRSYAIAITETATPALRQVLLNQMNRAIELHANVFYYMLRRGYYPSYNLEQLLQNDVRNARKALDMSY